MRAFSGVIYCGDRLPCLSHVAKTKVECEHEGEAYERFYLGFVVFFRLCRFERKYMGMRTEFESQVGHTRLEKERYRIHDRCRIETI